MPHMDNRNNKDCARCSHISKRKSSRRNIQHKDIYECALCGTIHALRFCRKFRKMSIKERDEVVSKHRYCPNCLAKSHDMRGCNSLATCRKCDEYHHTLLHPTSSSREVKAIRTVDLRRRQHHRQQQLRRYHKSDQRSQRQRQQQHQHSRQSRRTQSYQLQQQSAKRTHASQAVVTPSTMPITPVMGPIVDAIRSLATILSVSHGNFPVA